MKFSDCGIIISQRKYGENSMIVKIFSQNHGIYNGFVRSVKSAKNRAIFQVGNLVSFEYRARLEENLGQFVSVDLMRSYCSKIMFDNLRLNCVRSIFSIIDEVFLERDIHEDLFEALHIFLQDLADNNVSESAFLADYVRLELEILKTLGYGVDLSSCAATQVTENLAFVSPKSARAVCLEAGLPYKDKLLKLPGFLLQDEHCDNNQILNGMELSGYFLEKFIFEEKRDHNDGNRFFYRNNIKKKLKEY